MNADPTPAPAATALPSSLRSRILSASQSARAAGRPVGAPDPARPVDAFRRTAEALGLLLADLTDAEWARPAIRDLTVQGLIGHLVGVERDLQRALAGDPLVADVHHVRATQDAALAAEGEPPAATLAAWTAAVQQTLDLSDGASAPDGDRAISLHRARLPLSSWLVARTFELWTHEHDIRAAVGRPRNDPAPDVVALMTSLATSLLPFALHRAGLGLDGRLRLILTGPGGGTWQLGESAGDAPTRLRIVADAVDFCRIASNRLAPAALVAHVDGDDTLARRVLEVTTTLGLD